MVFGLLVYSIGNRSTYSWVLTLAAFWLSSIIPMLIIGGLMERRDPAVMLNPKAGSWMFIFGDSIFLPIAGLALVYVWHNFVLSAFFYTWTWTLVSAGIGLAAGVAFHFHDRGIYDPLRLNSPTKLLHDFVAYPLLFGGLVLLATPVVASLFGAFTRTTLMAVAIALVIGVGGWVVSGVLNSQLVGPLNITKLHVQWDWRDPIGVYDLRYH